MILVDIQVPSINMVYDFELDEETPAWELVREAAETIAEKERLGYSAEEGMHLYAMNHEKILNDAYSLKQQGIRSGEKLVLI